MNSLTRTVAASIAVAVLTASASVDLAGRGAAPPEAAAKALFDRYAALERAFDVALADLYADDAVIINKRRYPTGEVRQLRLPAPQYKQLIRQAMPLAKQQNDTNRYSDCIYKPNGSRVEITCQRFSERKQYTSPIRLIVGPDASGSWVIQEEHSESIP